MYVYQHTLLYIYMCVCACVCVCARARARVCVYIGCVHARYVPEGLVLRSRAGARTHARTNERTMHHTYTACTHTAGLVHCRILRTSRCTCKRSRREPAIATTTRNQRLRHLRMRRAFTCACVQACNHALHCSPYVSPSACQLYTGCSRLQGRAF